MTGSSTIQPQRLWALQNPASLSGYLQDVFASVRTGVPPASLLEEDWHAQELNTHQEQVRVKQEKCPRTRELCKCAHLLWPVRKGSLSSLGNRKLSRESFPVCSTRQNRYPAKRVPQSVTAPAKKRLFEGWNSPRLWTRQLAACVAHALAMKAVVPCNHAQGLQKQQKQLWALSLL